MFSCRFGALRLGVLVMMWEGTPIRSVRRRFIDSWKKVVFFRKDKESKEIDEKYLRPEYTAGYRKENHFQMNFRNGATFGRTPRNPVYDPQGFKSFLKQEPAFNCSSRQQVFGRQRVKQIPFQQRQRNTYSFQQQINTNRWDGQAFRMKRKQAPIEMMDVEDVTNFKAAF